MIHASPGHCLLPLLVSREKHCLNTIPSSIMITGGSAVQKLFDGSYEIYLKNSINLFYRYITNGHKRFSIFSRCCRKIPRRKLLFVVQNSGRQVLFNLEEISFPSLSLLSLKKILIYFQNGSLTGILVLQENG